MGSLTSQTSLLAEDSGVDFPEPTETLYDILTKSAYQHPTRTALVSCHQLWGHLSFLDPTSPSDRGDCLRLNYAQLENASDYLAAYLSRNGIREGDAIVVMVPSCAEWALCFWAAARLGCPFVPLNPVIASRANEIQHVLSALGIVGALLAGDENAVKLLSNNAPSEVLNVNVKLILGGVGKGGWLALNNAFAMKESSTLPSPNRNMQDIVLIVLTSGTTALPKWYPHTNRTVASMCIRHRIMYSLDETRVSCNHMPLFHLAGVMESLWAWAHGSTVVYPDKSFNAGATLDAIHRQHCTDMCLVPSMLHAMVDHPKLSTSNTNSLGLIKLAANDVRGSDARACSEILGAKTVTNCFGMTETSGMTQIYAWKDGLCKDSEPFPVGRMAAGAKARICAPDSREPLNRGVIGELHQGGKTIADRYISGENNVSSFYTDKTGPWHISGDSAIMAETGEICVLGRYKDIINRAGENISPSTVERVLNKMKGIHSSQVIGVPDEVAGEVPVAVIKVVNNGIIPKSLLYEHVIKELGVAFALERIMYLKELGLNDFPTTATGKVRKVDVKHLVTEHMRHESKSSSCMTVHEPTVAALTRIWAHFSGVPEDRISPSNSLEGMVDSVTVMRFRSQVKKELGKTLSLEELNQNPTVLRQADILDRHQEVVLRGTEAMLESMREGVPALSDVVHACGNQVTFDGIRRDAERELHSINLSWDADVQEVLPIYDFLQYWRASTESIIFRIAFACAQATKAQLRSSIETALTKHGMLRTMLVDSTLAGPSWVIIRPSSRWFDRQIKDGGIISRPEDLLTTTISYQKGQSVRRSKPVPLFYITLYHIEATQSAGFVVYGDHSTYDARSVLSLFIEDLGKTLQDPAAVLPSRPSYNLFANSYYNYRTSVPAQLNLEYYCSRFKGIAQRRGALWPQESFQSVHGSQEQTADQLLLQGDITPGLTGITKHIKIDMSNNQYLKVAKIPHSVAIKAAIAIYNTQQTGHPYAFFSNLQMCRSYPFLDPQIADRLPDPMDMPGATIEVSFDNLYLDPSEQVSSLLHRMHHLQKEDTARAQFPSLRLQEQLEKADSEFLPEVLRRQAINYNPVVTPDPKAPLQNLQFAGNANLSFMWWCGMVDAETLQMRVTWNDEVMETKAAEAAMEGFERNMKWLVNGDSWAKTLKECNC